jgi:hypothetical protein
MRRTAPSPIARQLVGSTLLSTFRVQTILDFGCGIGRDVSLYRAHGYEVEGYDPHEPFGFQRQPAGRFDLVTCLFVLNVIADPGQRKDVCTQLVQYTRPNGLLVIATRSPQAIRSEASRKNWLKFSDGYLSSASRGTFQRGISADEIGELVGNALSELPGVLTGISADCAVLVLRNGEDRVFS